MATVLILVMGQQTITMKALSPIVLRMGTIYWNLQWDVPPRWVSYFTLLNGEAKSPVGSCNPNAIGTHGDKLHVDLYTHR